MPVLRAMPWPARLAVAAVVVELSISANLLTWIGVPYVTDGGLLILKIHPGTYLIVLAFLCHAADKGRPSGAVWALCGGAANLALYLAAIAACLADMLVTTGVGNMIVLIDTFLPAGLLACVLADVTDDSLTMLRRVLQLGVCANAILALGEVSAKATLVPLYLSGAAYYATADEFRPTALYDHPLTGGVMTLIGLSLTPRGALRRHAYAALLWAALLAFGGRVAVAVAAVRAIILISCDLSRRVLRRDRDVVWRLLCAALALGSGACLATLAFYAGFGDRLLGHLYWDSSAQTRLAQWHLLDELDVWQIVFGTRRDDLLALLNPLWLNDGVEVIENFWLLMFASLGVFGFPIFAAGFLGLLVWSWRVSGLQGRLLMLSVLAVASTSNSLGRKSTLLVGLIAGIACLRVPDKETPTALHKAAHMPGMRLTGAVQL